MKHYQWMRYGRIAISIAIAAILTLLWTERFDSAISETLGRVEKTQIVVAGTMVVAVAQLMFWLIVSSVFGRIYCSGVCPLGTWFDLVSRVGRAARRRHGLPCHYNYTEPLNRLRLTLLGVIIACMAGGITLMLRLIEPTTIWHSLSQQTLQPTWDYVGRLLSAIGITGVDAQTVAVEVIGGSTLSAALLSLLILIAVSIPAWKNGRTFCNTICPVGTALSLTSRHSLWRIDIDTDLCINCGRCADECKGRCINLTDHVVDMSRCVNCYDCLTRCPNNAIFYRPSRKQLAWPMLQSINPPLKAPTTIQAQQTQNLKEKE